jgi:hypothetical protein
MKVLTRFLINATLSFVICVCSGYAQSGLELKNRPIKNNLLAEILNKSNMQELKTPSPASSPYFIRLFSLDGFSGGNCAPDLETEVTCSIRYFLAINDGSLGVPGTIYDLGEVGEISKIEWLENTNLNFARLRLELTNFPTPVFEYNPKLVKKTKTVELFVNLNSLKIKAVL